MKKKEKVKIQYKGIPFELVGVKAMLRSPKDKKLIWVDVDIDKLVLVASMNNSKLMKGV